MTKFTKALAVVLASLGFALPASATTFSVDYSDLWYNFPAESEAGWGINFVQQNDVIFATMFVYDTDRTPTWFSASGMRPSGTNQFSGQLFRNLGSYYGSPWSGTTSEAVGTMTVTFSAPNNGTLTYNVGTTTVTKSITRVSTAYENLNGHWFGGTVAAGAQCSNGILINGEMTVTQTNNTAMRIDVAFSNSAGQQGACTYNGTYSQVGSMGSIDNGTYSCTVGGQQNSIVGNFAVSEIRASRNGFSGRINGTTQFCSYNGYFGGVRDVF